MTTKTILSRPDTTDMVIVHRCFRRQFEALPALIRSVPDGDAERASVVLGFLTELAMALHHHHLAEDQVMWPILLERLDDGATVLRMEEQHERIAELLDLALTQGSAFRTSAREHRGDQLATTLTALSVALNTHLDDEEAVILPLVREHLTVEEWAGVGEAGHAAIPKDRMLVFLGYLLIGTTKDERAFFLARSPLAARIAWKVMGRRRFEADYRRIYGRCSNSALSAGPTSR